MPPAGDERTLARWREAGEWWAGETPREIARYVDGRGIEREAMREMPPIPTLADQAASYEEDHTEDWVLRVRKVRDEKVARAMGHVKDPVLPQLAAGKQTYAALHLISGYSFGRGAMLAEELPAYAARGGVPAAMLADRFSLAGAVEFDKICRQVGIKPLIGASIEVPEGGEIVVCAPTPIAYRSLSRLISECHLDEPRLFPLCAWERLERHAEGLVLLTGGHAGPINRKLMGGDHAGALRVAERLAGLVGNDNLFVQIERSYQPWEIGVNRRLLELAERLALTSVAGGPVTHARPEHFPAQDVLTCIDSLCTIEEVVGRKPSRHPDQPQVSEPPRRALNAERYLRTADEMRSLYRDRPDLLENTLRLAERFEDQVLPGRSQLPVFCAEEGATLREVTFLGAHERYRTLPKRLQQRIERELARIERLNFHAHFLIAWDMCRWAKEEGILFSGRGSVVDSVVAYCLGLSRIDAFEHHLHFDRFLPADGSKRPDIDIDFEANRREDVRQYLSGKYGKDHVATVAAVGAFCTRGIVREVGKVMGLPDETVGYLAKRLHGSVSPDKIEAAIAAKPELRESNIPVERFRWVFALANQLMDVPRNMRAHSSGVIVSRLPVRDYVPVQHSGVEVVPIIQWDKRSAKRCFDKFDVLCLRGNDVLSGAERRVRQTHPEFDGEKVPLDDPETYRAFRAGQLIGIPQSASPAMRQAHVRLRTQDLRDASLVQAGIRPGVGGAVKINELIARRRGKPYLFVDPKLEEILGQTYGIVVFQEQVDQMLQAFVGCTSGEAEDIRESIHKRRKEGYAESIKEEIRRRIAENGHSPPVPEQVCELICGFQGYGFAQGHALAFAEISIRSVWMQQNHPAEYFAALLNAQPAGYYGPATIANEARLRGVAMLRPDVNASSLQFDVQDVKSTRDPRIWIPGGGIRIPWSQVAGVSRQTAERLVAGRPYRSIFDVAVRAEPARDELENLALCGALESLHPNRRATLWAVAPAIQYAVAARKRPDALPLDQPEPPFPQGIDDFIEPEKAVHDRAILGLDVERHLMAFERERVASRGGVEAGKIAELPHGFKAFVVGLPMRLRFPPTSSGKRVVFFDLEDETGLLNVTCFDDTYQRDGHAIVCSSWATVLGEVQDRDGHKAFLAHRVFEYQPELQRALPQDAEIKLSPSDFLVG